MEGIKNIPLTALQVAITQVGVKEDPIGSNTGHEVNAYLNSVGLRPGNAWCQAFVYWCYQEAADQLRLPNPMIRTAGVLDCWNRTVVTKKLMALEAKSRPELVNVGDQIIFRHEGNTGHTGIVELVDKANKCVHTIEGNTNGDGGREGYEVMRKVRALNDGHLVGFIRY